MITPAVFSDLIRGMPGEDQALRNLQAKAVKWFWIGVKKQSELRRMRLQDLERRFKMKPSDPVAALLLTAAG